jgi:hypothetical protein
MNRIILEAQEVLTMTLILKVPDMDVEILVCSDTSK